MFGWEDLQHNVEMMLTTCASRSNNVLQNSTINNFIRWELGYKTQSGKSDRVVPPLVLKPGVDVIIREKRLVIVYQYSDLSLPGYSWLDRAEVIIMNSLTNQVNKISPELTGNFLVWKTPQQSSYSDRLLEEGQFTTGRLTALRTAWRFTSYDGRQFWLWGKFLKENNRDRNLWIFPSVKTVKYRVTTSTWPWRNWGNLYLKKLDLNETSQSVPAVSSVTPASPVPAVSNKPFQTSNSTKMRRITWGTSILLIVLKNNIKKN